MKKSVAVISSPEFGEIRSAVVDGTPLFVAKDICDALGISKYRDALTRLDEDERASISVDTLGGKQSMIAVNESGLYTLVFQSRKPEARAFRKWVTGEVLPNIRKHGVYMTPEVAMSAKNLKRLRKQMLEQMRKYMTLENAPNGSVRQVWRYIAYSKEILNITTYWPICKIRRWRTGKNGLMPTDMGG